jgi:cobalt-zinc-cadmium efflux system membrane fusion protein
MKHVFAFVSVLVVPLAVLSGCGEKPATQAAEAPAATPAPNPLEIEVSPDLLLEIKTGQPQWQEVSSTLSVAGRVEVDESRVTRVTTPVGGRITELNVVVGQHVERGQAVATVYSTELAAVQSAFLKSLTESQQADRAVARARQLLEAGVIGSAELQRREAEAAQHATEVASLRKQMHILGMSDEAIARLESSRSIDSVTHVVAAAAGLVLQRPVTQGQVVQPAETLCVLADLSSVWLVAEVPEEHAKALRLGKRVQAEIPALDETVSGTLTYISATVNPETRTIMARMDLPNPQRRYKPAMLANMLLLDGAERRLVVPNGAVVREGDQESVFVQVAPGRFALRRVSLGDEAGEQRAVLAGLAASDTIVIDGAFHLNNERRRQAVSRNTSE